MNGDQRDALIYVRISRDKAGAGLGVQRQTEDCTALAEQLGWRVVAVRDDNDLSAYHTRKPRPGYRQLLADIQDGRGNAVLVWHTDRLHRSPAELEEYINACEPLGIPTVTVKAGPLDLATPSGRMVARQLGAVARYEVEHAIERAERARAQAAAAGKWSGGRRPYGFEPDGVTVRQDEAEQLQGWAGSVLAGVTLGRMASDANNGGLTTSSGKPWTPSSIRDVLLRPRNAGLMVHRGTVVGRASWYDTAPLGEDRWRAVVATLTDPARRSNQDARRSLLAGVALCGICAEPVWKTGRRGGNDERRGYACRTRQHVRRDSEQLDQFVSELAIKRLSRADAANLLVADVGGDLEALHNRALALRGRLDELGGMFGAGEVDAAQLRAGTERLRAQLDPVEAAIADAARGSALEGVAGAADVAKVWEGLNTDRRRAVIDTLMTVRILPARRGRLPGWRPGKGMSYFNPDAIDIEWRQP